MCLFQTGTNGFLYKKGTDVSSFKIGMYERSFSKGTGVGRFKKSN